MERALLVGASLALAACGAGTAERNPEAEARPIDPQAALMAARADLERCARAAGDGGVATFVGRVSPDGALHVARVDGPFGRPARDCLADAAERVLVRPFAGRDDRPLSARVDLGAAVPARTLDRSGAE
jgi:hypothetical protein